MLRIELSNDKDEVLDWAELSAFDVNIEIRNGRLHHAYLPKDAPIKLRRYVQVKSPEDYERGADETIREYGGGTL